jgi:NADH:ubiquinone oxidoreductase subunit K
MMDELDLLKKDWKKSENKFQQVTELEIYKMIHKKSSSIVKLILIISVVEVLFWIGINLLFADDKYFKTLKLYHIDLFIQVLTYVGYAVVATFIYLFYKNFKAISTTDTVKELMVSIIKTRKIVQYYVWYNLLMFALVFLVVVVFQFIYDPNLGVLINKGVNGSNPNLFWIITIIVYLFAFVISFGLVWLFYRIVYGLLMRKLYENYEELKKIDF